MTEPAPAEPALAPEPITEGADGPVDADAPTLAAVAERVEPATPSAPADGYRDRLAGLADWWTTVSEQPAPQTVEVLWAAEPPPVSTPEATVSLRPFDVTGDPVAAGIAAADRAVDGGADLVLLSVPAAPDAATVLAAHLLGLDAVEAQGWPATGRLSDDDWMTRVTGLRDGLRRLHGAQEADAIAGRLEDGALVAGAAVVLQCAARGTPLLVEGLAGAVAGLLAQRATRTARQWWLPADGPAAGAPAAGLHDRVLAHLRHEPLLRLGLVRDDATGVRLGLTLLEAALA